MVQNFITLPIDLNGRVAIMFIREVSQKILSPLYIRFNDREANAHSLLGILSLGLMAGDKVLFIVNSDEDFNTLNEIINDL